ncbi:MAG TPA: hypothetical protein VM677_21925 [Actinokineospora sp.]|nr:hypothetical protein [Actinokineospora sp.]
MRARIPDVEDTVDHGGVRIAYEVQDHGESEALCGRVRCPVLTEFTDKITG